MKNDLDYERGYGINQNKMKILIIKKTIILLIRNIVFLTFFSLYYVKKMGNYQRISKILVHAITA